MVIDRHAYLTVLIQLLPRGAVWNIQPNSHWWKLLDAKAEGLHRLHLAANTLLDEADPRTTYELLPDFERVLRLTDIDGLSIADRRAVVCAKLLAIGGATPAYFIEQAEALGYQGTSIDEYDLAFCTGDCEQSLFDEPWLFTFTMNLPAKSESLGAVATGSCDDFLGQPQNSRIEQHINRIKQSHTFAIFTYHEA